MADLQNINDIIKNNKFVVISSGDERTDKGYPIRIFNFKDIYKNLTEIKYLI